MLPFSPSKHKYVTFWQTQTACENTLGWNQFCYPRSAVHMEGDECCFTPQFQCPWSQQPLRTKIITHVHNHFLQDSGKVLLDGAQSCWLSLSVPTFSKPLILQGLGLEHTALTTHQYVVTYVTEVPEVQWWYTFVLALGHLQLNKPFSTSPIPTPPLPTRQLQGIVQRAYTHIRDHSQHILLMADKVRLLHHFVQITGHLKPPVAKI